jgi:hypothetical protein
LVAHATEEDFHINPPDIPAAVDKNATHAGKDGCLNPLEVERLAESRPLDFPEN